MLRRFARHTSGKDATYIVQSNSLSANIGQQNGRMFPPIVWFARCGNGT
jgi:hypothetical protein